MYQDEKILRIRRATIARLEEAGDIPRLDREALYGPKRRIRYVEIADDIGPPLRKTNTTSTRRRALRHPTPR
jgi:hypothetical protein